MRTVALLFLWASVGMASPLRLNHIQMKGTHNSYHKAMPLTGWTSIGYTHAPLIEQLEGQGVRQLELDIHECRGGDFCVYHISVIDPRSTCGTLRDCLGEVKSWSQSHRDHHPIFIFLEIKESTKRTKDWSFFGNLENHVLSVFNRRDILMPDDVRGQDFTLRHAIVSRGWPEIDLVRGKIVFVLLDEGGHRDNYTLEAPSLQRRLMFTTSSFAREDAAIIKVDDPQGRYKEIQGLAQLGFMVRTRADADLKEGKAGDFTRLEAALSSGAHMISTDFPIKSDFPYFVEIPAGTPSRCNPISAPLSCREQDL